MARDPGDESSQASDIPVPSKVITKGFILDPRSPISQQILYSPTTLSALADPQHSEYLKRGLGSYHGPGHVFTCEVCSANYLDQRHLKCHWTAIHGFPNPVSCPTCRRPFPSNFLLTQHIMDQHGQRCPLCDLTVVDECFLKSHVENVHYTILEFQCTLCADSFSSTQGLMAHLDTVHKNPDGSSVLYQCPHHKCHSTFFTEKELNGHFLSHDKTIFCGICQSPFEKENKLKQHLFTFHMKMREPPI